MDDLARQLHEFLTRHRLVGLATASKTGVPHASVMYYLLKMGDPHLYFMTGEQSTKYKQILENPHVAFAVGQENPNMELQIQGDVTVLPENEAAIIFEQLLAAVRQGPQSEWYIPPVMQLGNTMPKILSMQITHFRFSHFTEALPKVLTGETMDWNALFA